MEVKIDYKQDIKLPLWLLNRLDGNELLAKLLIQRGIDTPQQVEEFLDSSSYQATSPEEFSGLKQAVKMILEAVERNKSICVYGDYDADGVTSTAILVAMLEKINANVSYHIPDRFTEGYGMENGVIRNLADEEIDLIITCDCGISNQAEIALAKDLGLDVIVTDHHDLPDELPSRADVLLSPKFLEASHQSYHLPGAGMAYFLAKGVLAETKNNQFATELIDLAALAIVADVVKLRGENRYLLKKGLQSLSATNWVGIEELSKVAGVDLFRISETDIGFKIGPRLNAAGRVDNADIAVELLLTNKQSRAKKLANKLDNINTKRKDIGKEMEKEALELVNSPDDLKSIILYQPSWHQGIVGIVAGRLSEKYSVPVLLLCDKQDSNSIITGSARSIEGVHIRDALAECKTLLSSFGGHAKAAGCSLLKDDFGELKSRLSNILDQKLTQLDEVKEISIDQKLELEVTDLDLYQDIRILAPFGEGNKKPLFYSTDLEVISHRPLNKQQNLLLTVSDGQVQRTAIWWQADKSKLATKVDLVYTLEVNTWQGQRNLQLEIKELIPKDRELKKDRELNCELKDWRKWKERGREFPEVDQAVYYYEGTKQDWPVETIDRYYSELSDKLVLLSCPPNLKILQNLLYTIKPKELILAYSQYEIKVSQKFINQLVGLVKYILKKKKGITEIYTLASLLGERELTISLGLKYLQAKGEIRVQFVGPDRILLKRDDIKRGSNQQQELNQLLRESRSFREYMLDRGLEVITKLINK